ncbi:LuxR C-terminal-related transcriptional regulator [Bradyrhizobium ganzhouense]|uniref:helix-turn-helix transcriptional regulator n=1 Tax=Bradyrhizobium ganzhouense TaxID=1179767 RepID=UPI003CEA3CD8
MDSRHEHFRFRAADLELAARCQRLVGSTKVVVPFDHILVSGLDVDGLRVGSGTLLLSSFPDSYLETYYSEGCASYDPLVALTLSAKRPVTDEEAWRERKADAKHRRLRNLMLYHGIQNRTVVPLTRSGRTYGTVVVTCRRSLTDTEREYLQFIAEPLHDATSEPYADDVRARLHLTRGEIQCIALASRGLTSEAIAQQSAYSLETVNSYLKSATKKLGASNRTHAVVEAIRRKLIS